LNYEPDAQKEGKKIAGNNDKQHKKQTPKRNDKDPILKRNVEKKRGRKSEHRD